MVDYFDTPRKRRLDSDLERIKKLKEESTIIDFQAYDAPSERYLVTFKGKGLQRKMEFDPVSIANVHRVEIRLGIDYPRSKPDLQWVTDIYHPNISATGAVCLGGYSTNWVPSVDLDELCEMLWDMIRYANYDTSSPYNYSAAKWAEKQTEFDFPLDPRPLRDKVQQVNGSNVIQFKKPQEEAAPPTPTTAAPAPAKKSEEIFFIDDEPAKPSEKRPAKGEVFYIGD